MNRNGIHKWQRSSSSSMAGGKRRRRPQETFIGANAPDLVFFPNIISDAFLVSELV